MRRRSPARLYAALAVGQARPPPKCPDKISRRRRLILVRDHRVRDGRTNKVAAAFGYQIANDLASLDLELARGFRAGDDRSIEMVQADHLPEEKIRHIRRFTNSLEEVRRQDIREVAMLRGR